MLEVPICPICGEAGDEQLWGCCSEEHMRAHARSVILAATDALLDLRDKLMELERDSDDE